MIAGLLLLTPSIGFVDLSIINGDVIVRDGTLLTTDLQASLLLTCQSNGFSFNAPVNT